MTLQVPHYLGGQYLGALLASCSVFLVYWDALVYYEHEIPHFFGGDAEEPDLVLRWLRERVEGADIEAVRGEMLERMIIREEKGAIHI